MKGYRHIIIVLLLFIFGSTQFIDLHHFSHDDEDDDCPICEYTIEHLEDIYTMPTEVHIIPPISSTNVSPLVFYTTLVYLLPTYRSNRNKAPPIC